MMPDLVQRRCGAASPPPSLATLLHHLGFASPKARVVSAHLTAAKGLASRGPRGRRWDITRASAQLLRLCGECRQLGPLGLARRPLGPHRRAPRRPTRGHRKGSKVWGLLDSCSGPCFSTGPEGRFHSESSVAVLCAGLSHTRRHVVVRQEGARSHTSQALQDFCQAQAARLTLEHWPSGTPPIAIRVHTWGRRGQKRPPMCSIVLTVRRDTRKSTAPCFFWLKRPVRSRSGRRAPVTRSAPRRHHGARNIFGKSIEC